MNEEFLPCPFEVEPCYPRVMVSECRGEGCRHHWLVMAACDKCSNVIRDIGDTEAEAIDKVRKRWNTRYRDPKDICIPLKAAVKEVTIKFKCSNCGADMPDEAKYCCNCGAEVVDI